MKDLIANLSDQISEAIQIGEKTNFIPSSKTFGAILVCGLGGSGIGGKIVSLLLKDELKIPFLSINEYDIPAWVNENTLVIACSYSGNTEETLAAVESCKQRGSEIAVVTSGGTLLERAKENNWNHYVVPRGEQPRAMLAYSFIQQLYILNRYNLISNKVLSELKDVPAFIIETEQEVQAEAMRIAKNFHGKQAIIYSSADFEGVAVRWRQQINENSKELCWHHVFPEMTHNELVGWAGGTAHQAPIFLLTDFDHVRTKKRWEISKGVIGNQTDSVTETNAKGANKIAQNFYLIHVGDWVSYYMSEMKSIDPVEVEVIMHLKGEMAKLKD